MSIAPLILCPLLALAARPGEPDLPFERYQLANGMTVLLHADTRMPLVAVSVWYDVGGLHEKPKKSGFAHLFEHMMFQGSPHAGEDMHFKRLERAGATGVNGTTENDRTNYFETVPSNQLELALWLEADRMGFLLSSLTERSLKNQIEVVKNERRQSFENAPYGLFEEKIIQAIYPPAHPYHGMVIGSMEDLGNATLEDVQAFFRTYYTPANAVLALAGDFDPAQAKALVERYFGSLRGAPRPPPVQVPAPEIAAEIRIDHPEPVARLAKLALVWMAPSAYQPDSAELALLAHVISGVRSSRLDKRVTFDDLIAQSVSAVFDPSKSGSLFRIELVVQPGRTLEEAEKAVDEVLADLRKRPPTQAELTRAKNAFEVQTLSGLESLGGFHGRAEVLQRYQLYLGDAGKLAWDLERHRRVTVQDLSRVLSRYLNERRVVAYARPAKKGS